LCALLRFDSLFRGIQTAKKGRILSVELTSGEQVGKYRVDGMLGRGATACVYRALGPDDEAVALKLILDEVAYEATFRHRFELEASIAERVKHPNVVAVLDRGEYGGVPWLTQMLIHGGSLRDQLDERGSLPLEETVQRLEEVGAGLTAVHEHGLVHRDVKPANILLKEDGTACVTDFGLARDTLADRHVTRPGQMLGTMHYMAPEQIEVAPVGPYTDVYSLACVVYECLVGHTPFADRPGMGVMLAQLEDTPEHPSDANAAVPRQVGDAVMQALAKKPEERPQSTTGFATLVRTAADA
jgi:serine/threonine protein kinase